MMFFLYLKHGTDIYACKIQKGEFFAYGGKAIDGGFEKSKLDRNGFGVFDKI
jgi:hypothetical protein